MRWLVFVAPFVLGCAVGVDPLSTRADGAVVSDTASPEVDSAVSDTASPKVDAGPCKLVVNEVQTGDGTTGTADFVELYNACSSSAAIGNYKLVYRSASGTTDIVVFTFAAGESIPARGYRVIGGAGFAGAVDGALVSGLATGGASVALKNDSDSVLDSLAYGTGTGDYVEGSAAVAPGDKTPAVSISRSPDGADTNDNASDFKVGTPTPGAANAP